MAEVERYEVEVDTQIVDLYAELSGKGINVDLAESRVRSIVAHAEYGGWGQYEYIIQLDTGERYPFSILKTVELTLGGEIKSTERLIDAIAEYDEALRLFFVTQAELLEWTSQYTGWSRFYLVAGGHIHSSMDCSSCNKGRDATKFIWLPNLSGLTEAEAVEDQGAILCTVCFPSAPVEYTNAHELAREQRQANRCPGSGKYVSNDTYRCPECNEPISVSWQTGKIRAHNKPK
jgi:hypothetical protein